MKLYYSPGACSLSPHIVLREAALPFTLEKVDLKTKKTAGGADYYSINSKGTVPALQLDDGRVLTEGPAVVQYIADQKPESGLAPRFGTFERYQLMEMLNYITSELHKSFSPLFHADAPADAKAAAVESLGKKFDWLSPRIASGKYVMGDAFTVADAYLYTVLRWTGLVKIDLARWPTLSAYLALVGRAPRCRRQSRPRVSSDSVLHGVAPDGRELKRGKPRVEGALSQQLGMGPHGDLAAVIHHHDAVGLQHGRQPMRNDDGGATAHESLERLLAPDAPTRHRASSSPHRAAESADS